MAPQSKKQGMSFCQLKMAILDRFPDPGKAEGDEIREYIWNTVCDCDKDILTAILRDNPQIDEMTDHDYDDQEYNSSLARFQSKLMTALRLALVENGYHCE
jgi:hypothetical protein